MAKTFKRFPKYLLNTWEELAENCGPFGVCCEIAQYLSNFEPRFIEWAEKFESLPNYEDSSLDEINAILFPMLDDIEQTFGTEAKECATEYALWQ